MTTNTSGEIAARLDRLVLSASLKKLVLLISLGGAFEFYDLLMTADIAPGLLRHRISSSPARGGFFAPRWHRLFRLLHLCRDVGRFASASALSPTALDGEPSSPFRCLGIFSRPLVMAFQHSAAGIDLSAVLIAAIGVGLEQVTIDIAAAGAGAGGKPWLGLLPSTSSSNSRWCRWSRCWAGGWCRCILSASTVGAASP